jgi:trehalose 6-phosphate phosphatase
MDLDLSACALFLDLDGTLIEIAPTPDGVTISEGLAHLLERLEQGLGGALAIVTGRSIGDVDRLLAPLAPVAAGVHGAEIRPLPRGAILPRAAPIEEDIVDAVRRLAADHPGVLFEPKRFSVAVHYRQRPALAPALELAMARLLQDERHDHLVLAHGRQVLEIVPRQVSKGVALEVIMQTPRFAGRRPIMVGDDITDISAMTAAIRLGGKGLKVAGERFSRTEADFSGTSDVIAWLEAEARRLET